MLKRLDDFLNGITMYRLMLYCLIFLVLTSVLFSFFKLIPFTPFSIIFSALFLTATCWITNKIFAKLFRTFTNLESVYITAMILALIVTPIQSAMDVVPYFAMAFLSQASKYLLAINRKHIFNPAAFAVTVSGVVGFGASWWVGTSWMIPPILIIGFLIIKKVQRFSLTISFLLISLFVVFGFSILKGFNLTQVLRNTLLENPILFFTSIMLTEPLTSPVIRKRQVIYGILVGLLYSRVSPEVALLIGNVFSYIFNPRKRLLLRLRKKLQIAPDIYEFIFESQKLNFLPGQYMEWTLSHDNPDNRGVRRYFTIAASPTEDNIKIGIKFYPRSSSFKKSLLAQNPESYIFAGELSGEFILPKDSGKKLCLIAGGIGVTPFRSMIKYLLDTGQRRDIVLLYFAKSGDQFVYRGIFDDAGKKLGIKTVYITERLNDDLIIKEVPDYYSRTFYISGPHSMVDVFKDTLNNMGIMENQIKVDFFPGYV